MKDRLCIADELLTQYLCGDISDDLRETIETHLENCDNCLELLAESYALTKRNIFVEYIFVILCFVRKHIYTIAAACSLMLSFVISKYFFQFLLASALFGIKSIVNSKTTKMLIMVKESLKKENKDIHDPIKK